MDVIALRKNSGKIEGNVYVNGYPQDEKAFRRCSGYVEQFDIQSPQLTVRETVLFSGRLRIDADKIKSDKQKKKYCELVLQILELTPLADSLVGSKEEGGLSFEQKKRLSIAVELAASPSILFLDEVRGFAETICIRCNSPSFLKRLSTQILCSPRRVSTPEVHLSL
jgi:ABC-type multidrug transport system ATPase subunit